MYKWQRELVKSYLSINNFNLGYLKAIEDKTEFVRKAKKANLVMFTYKIDD